MVLQEAQQRHLAVRAQGFQLVEKQRAALGLGDEPLARLARIGERAARVTEQLAANERVGQRSAIDGHERSVGRARLGNEWRVR